MNGRCRSEDPDGGRHLPVGVGGVANKQPMRAIYKERSRLFCPLWAFGRPRRVLCYQYGGETRAVWSQARQDALDLLRTPGRGTAGRFLKPPPTSSPLRAQTQKRIEPGSSARRPRSELRRAFGKTPPPPQHSTPPAPPPSLLFSPPDSTFPHDAPSAPSSAPPRHPPSLSLPPPPSSPATFLNLFRASLPPASPIPFRLLYPIPPLSRRLPFLYFLRSFLALSPWLTPASRTLPAPVPFPPLSPPALPASPPPPPHPPTPPPLSSPSPSPPRGLMI